MKLRFSLSSITFRLLFMIIASQTLLLGLFSYLIIESGESSVKASEDATFKLVGQIIDWSVHDEIGNAMLSIATVTEDRKAMQYFEDGLREELRQRLAPFFERIKERVIRFHFHSPDGTSFLRMHDPGAYGDRIADERPMIAAAQRQRSTLTGIEKGRDGLGIRVVKPIFGSRGFAGLVEFGMEFGEGFLSRLKEKQEGDYYLFLFGQGDVPSLVAGTRPSDRCPMAESGIDALRRGERLWSIDCSQAKGVGLYPFSDFAGNPIGFIKAEFQHIPLAEALMAIRDRLILFSAILVLALAVIVAFSMNLLNRPLHKVVAQTKEISQRILAGDTSSGGDVAELESDFKPVIDAVNEIIAALRERESVLQAIVQGIPGIVFYVDEGYNVVWANDRARVIDPDLVGKNLRSGAGGFFENEARLLESAFAEGSIQCLEACYLEGAAPGRTCWEHVAVPIRSEAAGGVGHVIRISTDVSAKRRAEDELRRLNEELERRVESEVRRRQEGERIAEQQSRLAAIGELATGMAHEITQPLNSISFAMENLKARLGSGSADDAYVAAKTAAIGSDIDRARRVIDHVRIFARSAREEYQTDFDPSECVESALSLISVQFATRGIDLSFSRAGEKERVLGNPYKYEQVVLNLLTNARDAVEQRLSSEAGRDEADPLPGRVEIRVERRGASVVLEVEDNGAGIDPSISSRIFDPFFSTKPPGKGTGLGLSISFGIVRDMGGTIALEPRAAGPGAIARVSLPARGGADA